MTYSLLYDCFLIFFFFFVVVFHFLFVCFRFQCFSQNLWRKRKLTFVTNGRVIVTQKGSLSYGVKLYFCPGHVYPRKISHWLWAYSIKRYIYIFLFAGATFSFLIDFINVLVQTQPCEAKMFRKSRLVWISITQRDSKSQQCKISLCISHSFL